MLYLPVALAPVGHRLAVRLPFLGLHLGVVGPTPHW